MHLISLLVLYLLSGTIESTINDNDECDVGTYAHAHAIKLRGRAMYIACDNGYSFRSVNRNQIFVYCANGTWGLGEYHEAIPTCEQDVCSIESAPNMYVQYLNSSYAADQPFVPEGTPLQLVCAPGYRTLNGSKISYIKCIKGNWSPSWSYCTRISFCPKPLAIENGNFYCAEQKDCNLYDNLPDKTKIFYSCDDGYMLLNSTGMLQCRGDHWEGTPSVCVKRTVCDQPLNIANGNWFFVDAGRRPDFHFGTTISYTCNGGYRAVSGKQETTLMCLNSGEWSDFPPMCLPVDSHCGSPIMVQNGYYTCKPNNCNLFKSGTIINYSCDKGYELEPLLQEDIVCGNNGMWNYGINRISCENDLKEVDADKDRHHSNISTVAIVVSTSCSVLALLILVMILFLIKRNRSSLRHRHGGQYPPAGGASAPPPYSEMEPEARVDMALVTEHDRTALISFPDGTQALLPSYDEVTRGRYPTALHRFTGEQLPNTTTRNLPAISYQLRQHNALIREMSSPENHTRPDAQSLMFGSIDTMNVSDNTSTTVTLGTYESGSSNPSLATSRAMGGSLASSNPNLSKDDEPLLVDRPDSVSLHSHTASPSIPEEGHVIGT